MRARFHRRLRGVTLVSSAVVNEGECCLVGKSLGSFAEEEVE